MKKSLRCMALMLILCLGLSVPLAASARAGGGCVDDMEHQWSPWGVGPSGVLFRVCRVCDWKEFQCKHVRVTADPIAPTCTKAGLSGMVYCDLCGAILKDWQLVPAAGHREGPAPELAPTCTREGLTGGTACADCGIIIRPQTAVPALGHTEAALPAKAPACAEEGLTEGVACAVCGEILKAQETIPALGHTEETTAGKALTCTENGLTEGAVCIVCGEILKAQETIPAPGHTEQTVPGKEATCEESGLTEGKACAVCGEVLEAQQEIPPKGHSWDGGRRALVPCGPDGKRLFVCRNDSKHTYVADSPTHVLTRIPAWDAQGAEYSEREYWSCDICLKKFADSKGTQELSQAEVLLAADNRDRRDENKGTMGANFGTIGVNTGIIEENFGGEIEKNYGIVKKHYYRVIVNIEGDQGTVLYRGFTWKSGACYLEAGASGLIVIQPASRDKGADSNIQSFGSGSIVLGYLAGSYRITAPEMPEGEDGFAEMQPIYVNLVLGPAEETKEDNTYLTLDLYGDEKAGLLTLMGLQNVLGADDESLLAFVLSGITDENRSAVYRELNNRQDIMAVVLEMVGNPRYVDWAVFTLEDGTQLSIDPFALRELVAKIREKLRTDEERKKLGEQLDEILNYLSNDPAANGEQTEDILITLRFVENTDPIDYEETVKIGELKEPEQETVPEEEEEWKPSREYTDEELRNPKTYFTPEFWGVFLEVCWHELKVEFQEAAEGWNYLKDEYVSPAMNTLKAALKEEAGEAWEVVKATFKVETWKELVDQTKSDLRLYFEEKKATVEYVKDEYLRPLLDKAKGAAEKVAETAKEKARKAKEAVEEAARKLKEEIEEKARKAKEAAEEAARKAKEAAEEAARKAREAAEEAARKAKQAAEEAARKAKQAAEEAARKAAEEVKKAAETVVSTVKKTTEKVGKFLKGLFKR